MRSTQRTLIAVAVVLSFATMASAGDADSQHGPQSERSHEPASSQGARESESSKVVKGPRANSDLASAYSQQRETVAPTVFAPRRDGFNVDGTHFLDSMGKIVNYGGDPATGDVVYFVSQGADPMAVRYVNVHSAHPPITIGTLKLSGNSLRFESADGRVVAGNDAAPISNGVVLFRGAAIFVYQIDKGVSSLDLPRNYRVAPFQRGDVAGTGYIMLRHDPDDGGPINPVKDAADFFKGLTGKSDDNDYALFNIHTGNTVYLNIDLSGERVIQNTGCRAKNMFVNKCTGSAAHDALYNSSGLPNDTHYFWRAAWLPTSDGPTAVVIENGMMDMDVIRLDTGQRATAFHRGFGVQSFAVHKTDSGSLKVIASWAFQNHVLDDVRQLFAE